MKEETLEEQQARHRQEAKEIRDNIKERKARTHRLIVRGAILEKAFPDSVNMDDEQLLDYLIRACKPDKLQQYNG